jgi:hypothetical protein
MQVDVLDRYGRSITPFPDQGAEVRDHQRGHAQLIEELAVDRYLGEPKQFGQRVRQGLLDRRVRLDAGPLGPDAA